MANTSILNAFERMWKHIVSKLDNKADVDHAHEIDNVLSYTSENPVQNKTITSAFEDKSSKQDLRKVVEFTTDKVITEGSSQKVTQSFATDIYVSPKVTAVNYNGKAIKEIENLLCLPYDNNITASTSSTIRLKTSFSAKAGWENKAVFENREIRLTAGKYYFRLMPINYTEVTGTIIFKKTVYEGYTDLTNPNYVLIVGVYHFVGNETIEIDLPSDAEYFSLYVNNNGTSSRMAQPYLGYSGETSYINSDGESANLYIPLTQENTNMFPYPCGSNVAKEVDNIKITDNGDGTYTVTTTDGSEKANLSSKYVRTMIASGVETEYEEGWYTFYSSPIKDGADFIPSNTLFMAFRAQAVDGDASSVFEEFINPETGKAKYVSDKNGTTIPFYAAGKLGSMSAYIDVWNGANIGSGVTFRPNLVKGKFTTPAEMPKFIGYGNRNLVWKYSKNLARWSSPKVSAGIIETETLVWNELGQNSNNSIVLYTAISIDKKGKITLAVDSDDVIYTLDFLPEDWSILEQNEYGHWTKYSCQLPEFDIIYYADHDTGDNTLTIKGVLEGGEYTVRYYRLEETASTELIPVTEDVNGLTVTEMGGGSYLINGTATADTEFIFRNTSYGIRPNEQVTFSGCPSGSSTDTYYMAIDYEYADGTTETIVSTKDAPAVSNAEKTLISYNNTKIIIKNGQVCNNLFFYYQLELGTEATAYTRFYMPFIMQGTHIKTMYSENEDETVTYICEPNVVLRVIQNQKVSGSENCVNLTFDQTISGVKTFEKQINIGNATLTYDNTNDRLVISFS